MKKTTQDIRKALEGTSRQSVSLSNSDKAALWTRVQNMAEQNHALGVVEEVLETGNTHKAFWTEPLKWYWSLSISMTVVFIAIGGVYTSFDQTQGAQEQAQVAALQTADYSDRVLAQVSQEETAQEDTETTEDATQLAGPELPASAYSEDLQYKIGGFGGGVFMQTSLWTVLDATTPYATEQRTLPIYALFRYSENELRTLAATFRVNSPLVYYTAENNLTDATAVLSNMGVSDNSRFNETCFTIALDQTTVPEPCLYIDEFGYIQYIQHPSHSQSNGIEEAYTYIEQLSGLTSDDFIVIEYGLFSDNQENSLLYNVEQYILYEKNPRIDGEYYRSSPWHIATKDGGLVYLDHTIYNPQNDNIEPQQVISAAEAVQRMRDDLTVDIAPDADVTGPEYILRQQTDGSPFGYPLMPGEVSDTSFPATVPSEDVQMQIERVELVYYEFTRSLREDSKNPNKTTGYQKQLRPVWLIQGTELTGGRAFEMLIDSTPEANMINKQEDGWYIQ